MTHLDVEIAELKTNLDQMWSLVCSQLSKAREAYLNFDKNVAQEVLLYEKKVNAFELKIDQDCENIIALLNPVAMDLRLVLSTIKINLNLERIGDFAEGVAKVVINKENPFDKELIEASKIEEVFLVAMEMLSDVRTAQKRENSSIALSVFSKDLVLDTLTNDVLASLVGYSNTHNNTNSIRNALLTYNIIKKLERIGDRCNNIAEEIIFYLEAQVLKHTAKELEAKEYDKSVVKILLK